MQTKHNQKGFTLVEMSIVLVIIGLIISGILVGQDMIANARISATIQQIQKYDTAYNTFRQKYNGIPGDLTKATAFLANGAGNGDGDGVIDDADDDATQNAFTGEVGEAFFQLGLANMVDGTYTADNAAAGTGYPVTKLKKSGISLGANIAGTNYWMVGTSTGVTHAAGAGIAPAEAYGIDFKLDDGQPDTGNVRLTAGLPTAEAYSAVAPNDVCVNATPDYDLTVDSNNCMIAVPVTG